MSKNPERMLQDQVIQRLQKNGWELINVQNFEQLNLNFRNIVNTRNKDKLAQHNIEQLSDKEFERLMNKISNNTTINDYAQFLLDDDLTITLDNGKEIYLNLFNKKKWCTNKFQIISEFTNDQTSVNNNRYDLLFLINGFVVANLELKRNGVQLSKAFEQTSRYSNELKGLLKFIQVYVISNENNTLYYANNKVLNSKFAFSWVDEHNNRVSNIFDFIDQFLEKCNFSEYISRYVINQKNQEKLIALRAYQVHAVKKIINHVNQSKDNGYIWHTTGSGKTITSFKTAQIVNRDCDVDKVIFLVDRADLDRQTAKEYNSFLEDHEQLQRIENTKILNKQLKSTKNNLIVTTIQKMNRLLANTKNELDVVKNQRVVFIIDECHRSTFGEMYDRIKESFNNAQFIGFTGTPIFDHKDRKKDERITNEVFHKCLHKYLIKNAIEDNNVLAFQMDYFGTDEDDKISNISKYVESPQFVETVVKDIIQNHDHKTNQRQYFAIATFKNIETLIKAYEKMKQMQEQEIINNPNYKPLKVAAVFSAQGEENDQKYHNQETLRDIIDNFNLFTGSNESIKEIANYEGRLQSVIKDEKQVQIDIVFVVDKLLTGFDAKRLNTIYIAKPMKRHALIQAMSRTNRIFKHDKPLGIVVSYVPKLKEEVDYAIKLYSDSENSEAFISKNYSQLITTARQIYSQIKNIKVEQALEEPLNNLHTIKSYKESAKKLQEVYTEIKSLRQFKSSDIGKDNNGKEFSIDTMKAIVNNAFTLDSKVKELIQVPELDFQIKEKLIDEQNSTQMPLVWKDGSRIDHIYIINLIATSQENKDSETFEKRQKEAVVQVKNDENLQRTTLAEFIENLKYEQDVFEQIENYRQELLTFIMSNYEMSTEEIQKEIININLKNEYQPSQNDKLVEVFKNQGVKFKERRAKREEFDKKLYTVNALNELIERTQI